MNGWIIWHPQRGYVVDTFRSAPEKCWGALPPPSRKLWEDDGYICVSASLERTNIPDGESEAWE